MIDYLLQWFHAYMTHVGIWMTFIFACSIYKEGMPELKDLRKFFETAIILSVILSVLSSHSHINYINYVSKLIP